MRRKFLVPITFLALVLAGCTELSNDGLPPGHAEITVQVNQPGAAVSPAMWGAFFEDINFGGDGGLYAEMVKNRGFEFPDPMMGWFKISPSLAKGDVTIQTDSPYRPSQTHYARISSKADAPLGISNEGFRGMGVTAGDVYSFSAQVRNIDGASRVSVQIVGNDGTLLASAPLTGLSGNWSKVTATLIPKDTDSHARLALFLNGPGTVDFDFVSLFPAKTWKGRPGGLRADMVQALADLHPGFLRFPGGCIVEGSDLSKRYQWKNTVGPIDDRKVLIDRWNYEFPWRPTPDYSQSFGLGFFEFFQLCEDIGAQPLPVVNAGMACQFNSGELCPPDELGPYIQDALDLIEFANGPATSTWGAKRAAMGHPEPFNPPLKMLGVGNEQWGPQYLERLALFTKAIKAKYPDIQLVSDAGPSPDDDRFAYLWPKLQAFKVDGHAADIVDQHCYANPIWFLANTRRFDEYDRNGPKVFFGEYAARERSHLQHQESQQPGVRSGGSGLYDRPGAQRGCGEDGLLCAAVFQHRSVAMDARSDLDRFPPCGSVGQLLRAAVVLRKPGGCRSADDQHRAGARYIFRWAAWGSARPMPPRNSKKFASPRMTGRC